MALDLTRLAEEISRDNAVNASAATLINRLADELETLKTDDEALQARIDEMVAGLRANSDALANAVAAGTPVEGTEPPVTNPNSQPDTDGDGTPDAPVVDGDSTRPV